MTKIIQQVITFGIDDDNITVNISDTAAKPTITNQYNKYDIIFDAPELFLLKILILILRLCLSSLFFNSSFFHHFTFNFDECKIND